MNGCACQSINSARYVAYICRFTEEVFTFLSDHFGRDGATGSATDSRQVFTIGYHKAVRVPIANGLGGTCAISTCENPIKFTVHRRGKAVAEEAYLTLNDEYP
jgi:hypothetical protein